MNTSITAIITCEYNVPCSYRKGEYEWQVKTELRPEARQALNERIEARITLLETIQLILKHMDADIPLSVAAKAPLAPTIFSWIGAGNSTQHLRRQLNTNLDSARFYMEHAGGQIREDNQANAVLLELLLGVLDAKEAKVAA